MAAVAGSLPTEVRWYSCESRSKVPLFLLMGRWMLETLVGKETGEVNALAPKKALSEGPGTRPPTQLAESLNEPPEGLFQKLSEAKVGVKKESAAAEAQRPRSLSLRCDDIVLPSRGWFFWNKCPAAA